MVKTLCSCHASTTTNSLFAFANSFSFIIPQVLRLDEFPVSLESMLCSVVKPQHRASLKLVDHMLIAFGINLGVLGLVVKTTLCFRNPVNLLAVGAVPTDPLVAEVLAADADGSVSFAPVHCFIIENTRTYTVSFCSSKKVTHTQLLFF